MADQNFTVKCGFFNAVNGDRTYNAEDMNKPYSRVFGNGVFANIDGTPSLDLIVVTGSSPSYIVVGKGSGIFADKWFVVDSNISIDVPVNSSENPRIDSVIAQVDNRTEGRVGRIVYRTGTPAASPVAPSINDIENVVEYRIANISRPAGSSTVIDSQITDLRGSGDCPWIASLKNTDTGWLKITLTNGEAGYSEPGVRLYNGIVYIHGDITDAPASGSTIATLPSKFRPAFRHTYIVPADNADLVAQIEIGIDGAVKVYSAQAGGYRLYLDTSYPAN